MRHYIDPADLSPDEMMELIHTANEMAQNPARFAKTAEGKIFAALFFEPSTRTRLSFESAMLSLGGSVITVSGTEGSSVAKGESLADTLRMVTGYADICALRHPRDGAACHAAGAAGIPVINAGDGGHFHPTQTLTDLYAIYNAKQRLGDLTVGFCGDLKYGRPVHSLVKALSVYKGVKFVFVSGEALKLPGYVKGYLRDGQWREAEKLANCLGELDVLYMTRVQRERMTDQDSDQVNYEVLDAGRMKKARADMTVLHPLPRLDEIDTEIDGDPRAYYFKQARGGRYIRMALIKFLLEHLNADRRNGRQPALCTEVGGPECANGNCITRFERGIKQSFERLEDGRLRCCYCDKIKGGVLITPLFPSQSVPGLRY